MQRGMIRKYLATVSISALDKFSVLPNTLVQLSNFCKENTLHTQSISFVKHLAHANSIVKTNVVIYYHITHVSGYKTVLYVVIVFPYM